MVAGKLMRLQLKHLIKAGIFRRLSREKSPSQPFFGRQATLPQKELWGALRDIQKTAASETK